MASPSVSCPRSFALSLSLGVLLAVVLSCAQGVAVAPFPLIASLSVGALRLPHAGPGRPSAPGFCLGGVARLRLVVRSACLWPPDRSMVRSSVRCRLVPSLARCASPCGCCLAAPVFPLRVWCRWCCHLVVVRGPSAGVVVVAALWCLRPGFLFKHSFFFSALALPNKSQ